MAEQPEQAFNVQEKLDILRRITPYLRQRLIPSLIVPKLGALLSRELRSCILEKEDAGRKDEAVKLLIDKVLEEQEWGLNLFLDALRGDGDGSGWPQFLKLLENDSSASDPNDNANEYYAFIVHLLEGDIIEKLTEGSLRAVLRQLHSEGAFEDYEMELLRARMEAKGRYTTAVQMFTLLGMRSDNWPLMFFSALRKEEPELLKKIAVDGINPIVDKESSVFSSGGGASGSGGLDSERAVDQENQGEETQPKQLLREDSAQDAGLSHSCGAERGAAHLRDREKEVETDCASSLGGSQDRDVSEGSESAAAAVGEDDDEGGPHFSDDEKQETEDSEKNQPGREGPLKDQTPKELKLRDYQHELAARALQGINTIICAPTGSGKTRVALHIVRQHLMAERPGHHRKVVFLARTVPLVSQQHRNFKAYLSEYKCELVTGESENSMTVHQIMDKYDILVLTPKILENHLRPDKIPSLSAFSLIIFDECHHTRKGEPYNSVMKHYLKSKQQGESHLPQIVGLTASIGVEKATTPEEAKESILSIMGNLDVTHISQVIENVMELHETVPRPEEELVPLVFREADEISNKIKDVMLKIAEELEAREQAVKTDSEVDAIRALLSKRETDLKSQKFGQWAVRLRDQAKLLKYPKIPKNDQEREMMMKRQAFSWEVQVLADWLVAYNEAFDVHDLTRPEDVLHYLEGKSQLQLEEGEQFISTELVNKVRGYFHEVQKQLRKFQKQPNPNLKMLARTILKHIEDAGEDTEGFRILVFVRTRATCRALCRWLNSQDVDEQLRLLNAQHFTGTGAHQEHGGMTQYEQVKTLQRFKQGDVKLLVTTSVGEEGIDIAECNLTIRYNHVGNEVTTVQTRGRSRKRGGRSILMAMPKIIEQEELNRKREQLMYAALQLIREMPPEKIIAFVQKVQNKALEGEEIDQIMHKVKKLKKKEADFSVACPRCYKVKVNGAQIRKVNNAHHVIIGHDIDKQVIKLPGKTIMKMDDWKMEGSVICTCKNLLGQMLFYKKAWFIMVSPKYWVFLDKDNMPTVYKKWTKVPYHIEEVSPTDIKEHLGIQRNDDEEEDGHDAGGDEVLGATGPATN